ncbi:MAG: hypothetical protein LC745_06245, partial [Planctomycetia bacterium]|nr:hypothetical protein [Planctomycetia bacterium]
LAVRLDAFIRTALHDPDHPEDLPALSLERLPAPDRGFRLTSPAKLVPWLNETCEPTILLGKSALIVAANPSPAREALAVESRRADRPGPNDEVARAIACLPTGLTSLSIGNPGDSPWPEIIANLPSTVQYLGRWAETAHDVAADDLPTAGFFSVFGLPRPGGFRVRIDPTKVPKADTLRTMLFPSVLATSADDRGVRIIAREAIPFGCIPFAPSIKWTAGWNSRKGLDVSGKVKFAIGSGD